MIRKHVYAYHRLKPSVSAWNWLLTILCACGVAYVLIGWMR